MVLKKEAFFVLAILLSVVVAVAGFFYYKQLLTVIPTVMNVNADDEEFLKKESDNTQKDVLKIVAVGDILLGRGVGTRIIDQHGGDFTYPFSKVAEKLKHVDLLFGNLESPISDRGKPSAYKPINLKNSVKSFEGIKFAGFNILNLATNHAMDYGNEALFDTLEILEKNGIAFAGAGKNIDEARRPAIVEANGRKVGMLAYTDMAYIKFSNSESFPAAGPNKPGVAPRDEQIVKQDVLKLRDSVDILIVSFHWGIEESFEVAEEQRQLAHELIDLGADIIIGHHPHQFQAIEIYNGKPVIYSLGNFLFDQNDPENQETFVVNMEYEGNNLKKLYATPVRTIDKTQVVPQYGESALSMLERQVNLSRQLGTQCEIVDSTLNYVIN